jgi:hypothetical protein
VYPWVTMTKERIVSELSRLVGKPLWSAGRAADLQWFQFGVKKDVSDMKGRKKEVGEYAIHIQCAWRISSPSGIVVASSDRYLPKDDSQRNDEDFHWDTQGANLCDARTASLVDQHFPLVVKQAMADESGGFQLLFESDFRLEAFPDSSRSDLELWRLFNPYSEEAHFVVTGGGIEK